MHVIILHTDFKDPGGVGNYYSKIKGKFSCKVTHFPVGSRPNEKGIFNKINRFFLDYLKFYLSLKKISPDIVMINPSLDLKALFRDSIFLLISKISKKKCVVFFRGWHESTETKIERYGKIIFCNIYNQGDQFIVLSKNFVPILRRWGIKKPIAVERTIVDDSIADKLDIDTLICNRLKSTTKNVLFISRILKEKGIYETINAVALARKKNPKLQLLVAGVGLEYENVKRYILRKQFNFVKLLGYVRGEEKIKFLKKAHILCHPTYGEGMPNTVIECMAFGLPVITCPVGGIPDFFKNKINGFLTADRSPQNLSELILDLTDNKELYINISHYNFRLSKDFYASKAAKRLEKIFQTLL